MKIADILDEFEQLVDIDRVIKESLYHLEFEVYFDDERELEDAFEFVETLRDMNIFAEVHEMEPGLSNFYVNVDY